MYLSTPPLVYATERTTVVVDVSGFDKKTSGSGFSPDSCRPETSRDDSLDRNSHSSCKGDLVDGNGGRCIEYYVDER